MKDCSANAKAATKTMKRCAAPKHRLSECPAPIAATEPAIAKVSKFYGATGANLQPRLAWTAESLSRRTGLTAIRPQPRLPWAGDAPWRCHLRFRRQQDRATNFHARCRAASRPTDQLPGQT